MTSTTSTTEDRALALLGQGVPPQAVANALGVDISRISQLLSEDTFASAVIEKKYEALSKHNERDGTMDTLEDKLLDKLKDCLPFMTRPMEILKSFQILNAAKRRGQTAVGSDLTNKQTIIQLNIPQIILEKFQANIHNQVIQVGAQSLLTIPSSQLLKQTQKESEVKNVEFREANVSRENQATAIGHE